jgi:hypothetical protein
MACLIDLLELLAGRKPQESAVMRTAADAAEYCGLLVSVENPTAPTAWSMPEIAQSLCEKIAQGGLPAETKLRVGRHSEMALFDANWSDADFLQCFGQALADCGLPLKHSRVFRGALGEMIGNAQEHPQSRQPALATYDVTSSWWMFSVTDFGVGIPTRLRQNPKYSTLSDIDTLIRAVQQGVSTFEDGGRGHGFNDVMRVLVERSARVRIRSGRGLLELEQNNFVGDHVVRPKVDRTGCHVRVGAKMTAPA